MRHAQRHWLELQAKQAVEIAMNTPFNEVGDDEITERLVWLKNRHLSEAASALCRAEAVSRVLARRQGKV